MHNVIDSLIIKSLFLSSGWTVLKIITHIDVIQKKNQQQTNKTKPKNNNNDKTTATTAKKKMNKNKKQT